MSGIDKNTESEEKTIETADSSVTAAAVTEKPSRKERKLQKKLAKKERKKRWKETRKEDRRKLKEHYKDAPWFIRIPRLALRPAAKVIFWGLVAAVAIYIGVCISKLAPYLKYGLAFLHMNDEVTQEQIYEIAPLDTEGAERIAAYPGVDPDDTWTICIYMVGADLEDYNENDLSETAIVQVGPVRTAREEQRVTDYHNRLDMYVNDLGKNGLSLPEFLYAPEKPVARSEYVMDKTVVATKDGAATLDITEMLSAELSENITIVIQTGGATRWSNSLVNPNKTQRFIITKDRYFEQVENMPLQRATDPDTLSDFLRFCRDDYPADHTMLILWDHGGGPFGYGKDSIFGGGNMSIRDINTALSNVYTPDPANPAFDIIGFDACLMSNLEVTHELYGFASFYALSEESEPGDGWDYLNLLNRMSADPTMSPAAVAQTIADTFVDYCMKTHVNMTKYVSMTDVTFAVLDANKTEELYKAYSELAKHQLKDAAEDISVLADIGRCSNNTLHVASSSYDIYNLVDLGCYVDLMIDSYPEECSKIKDLLHESVLYHRETGTLADTQGISVYLPGSISSYMGLHYFLNYIYDICEDPYVRALYYYKLSGCLDDDMKAVVKTLTDAEPQVLDISQFYVFEQTMPVIEGNNFSVAIPDSVQSMAQDYTFELAVYDDRTGVITYYGQDEFVYLDGEGNLCCDFDGEWVFLDGQPLAIEMTSRTISTVEYRSHVLYNGKDAYLTFAFDRDTEEFEIKGIRLFPDSTDQINYMVDTKQNIQPQLRDTIIPLYPTLDLNGVESEAEGKKITYSSSTRIVSKPLSNGYYVGMASIYDQRGDFYNSRVISYEISGGEIKFCEVNPYFVGSDY